MVTCASLKQLSDLQVDDLVNLADLKKTGCAGWSTIQS